jgi:hypothetical protein
MVVFGEPPSILAAVDRQAVSKGTTLGCGGDLPQTPNFWNK